MTGKKAAKDTKPSMVVANDPDDLKGTLTTNAPSALTNLLPQLQPVGQFLLRTVSNAGTRMLNFLVSVIIAGLLFSPGPWLVITAKILALKLDSKHGEEFVEIARNRL